MQRIAMGLAVLFAFALTAPAAPAQTPCGGLLQPPCPPPPPAPPPPPPPAPPAPPPPPAPPAPKPPLSPERYAPIEKAIKASLPLDNSSAASKRRAYRAACKELSTSDRLLRAYRSMCLGAADLYDAYARRCESRRSCMRVLLDTARRLDRFVTRYKRLITAVDTTVTDKECRAALRPPRGALGSYRELAAASRQAYRAIKSRSKRRIDRALKRLERTSENDRTRSNRRQLRDLQTGCGQS